MKEVRDSEHEREINRIPHRVPLAPEARQYLAQRGRVCVATEVYSAVSGLGHIAAHGSDERFGRS